MIEEQIFNLAVQPHLHKADVGSSALQLSPIQVNQDYLNEWNNNNNDFVCLTKNGELLIPGSDDRMSLTDYASFWTLDQPINMVIYRKGQKKEINFIMTDKKQIDVPVPQIAYFLSIYKVKKFLYKGQHLLFHN